MYDFSIKMALFVFKKRIYVTFLKRRTRRPFSILMGLASNTVCITISAKAKHGVTMILAIAKVGPNVLGEIYWNYLNIEMLSRPLACL